MHVVTRAKRSILIANMLYLIKNLVYNAKESNTISIFSSITSNNTNNNIAYNSKKEPFRVRDTAKYFPHIDLDFCISKIYKI